MSWENYGVFNVTGQSSSSGQFLVGNQILRIQQSWNPTYPEFPGRATLLVQIFLNIGYWKTFSLYPSRDVRLLEIEYPLIFQQALFTIGTIEVKHNVFARIQADAGWTVNIDYWAGDLLDIKPGTVASGGYYE